MEDKNILEELCDMVFENAQPKTDSYRQKLSKAVEAREKLQKTSRMNKNCCLRNAMTR